MDDGHNLDQHDTKALNGRTLAAWRARMGYNQRDACKELGCSRTAWVRWEGDKAPVPRYIGLACAALALGMTEYGELRGDGK